MNSVLDVYTRDELISRIRNLHERSAREWGRMTLLQMLKHCILCEKLYFGEVKVRRSFRGILTGRSVLKKMLRDGVLISRNAPTSSVLIVTECEGDIETEKQNWIWLIERYADLPNHKFTHWFFGKMTPVQIGQFVYKHADHHLRQFNG